MLQNANKNTLTNFFSSCYILHYNGVMEENFIGVDAPVRVGHITPFQRGGDAIMSNEDILNRVRRKICGVYPASIQYFWHAENAA